MTLRMMEVVKMQSVCSLNPFKDIYFASCESKTWWPIRGELCYENKCAFCVVPLCSVTVLTLCWGVFSDCHWSQLYFYTSFQKGINSSSVCHTSNYFCSAAASSIPSSQLRHVVVETDGACWLVHSGRAGWWEPWSRWLDNEFRTSWTTCYVGRSCSGVTDHVRLLQGHQRDESQRRRRGERKRGGREEERKNRWLMNLWELEIAATSRTLTESRADSEEKNEALQ